MGTTSSLEKALETMDDEQLIAIIQQGYRHDAARMDKIIHAAKTRHLQSGGVVPSAGSVSMPNDLQDPPSRVEANTSSTTSPPSIVPTSSNPEAPLTLDNPIVGIPTPDRMAALWTFQGHTLRQLRSGLSTKKRAMPGTDATIAEPSDVSMVDPDGYPILYGSCGREKKYTRCSVCYFRGVRCNTSYYCACCQRPVCVRPRTYPGEEHPKICWNVLHVDKDMIHRVDKRRARKLHAASALADKAISSEDDDDAPLLMEARKELSPEELVDVESSSSKQKKTTDEKELPLTLDLSDSDHSTQQHKT